MLMHGFMRRLRARIRDEESGFTLIEVMVAIGVILVSLISLAYTANLAFSDAAFARQRQSANGIASQAIEQIRALPFDTVKKGLSSNDGTVTADTAITTCGADKCYQGEPIPMSGYAGGTSITPLVPHARSQTVGPTTYNLRTYVTYYQGNKTSNTFRVTAVVRWAARERAGASHNVQIQTVMYSPTGCLSTATHPFAAPCQPFFYGTSMSDEGHVDITGTIQTVPTFDRASVWLPGNGSNEQIEQTASVQGDANTSGVSIKYPSASETFQGKKQITTGADNDPATPGIEFDSKTDTQPALTAITNSGLLGSLTLSGSAGDTTSTVSTTSAGPAHPCANAGGANQNDLQPCGNGKSLQVGTLAASFDVTAAASDLGPATLVQILPPAATSPGFAFTNRDIAPEAAMCSTTSADGCMHSEAQRTVGQITLGTLPANVGPPPACGVAPCGWAGYFIRVTGVNDSVMAESGVGTTAPTVSAAGNITFYNGTGYTTCALYGAHVGACALDGNGNFLIPTLNWNDPLHPGVSITLTPTIGPGTTGTTATVATCTPACPNTRTDARSSSSSPVRGLLHYVVDAIGLPQADLTLSLNLGTLLAKASYQAAPSG
jgi:prepilin-type N-terminal cleavage/methylation domain-containing protein